MSASGDAEQMSGLLTSTAAAVRAALDSHHAGPPGAETGGVDMRRKGARLGQYEFDLVADNAALDVLRGADVGVLSEESGLRDAERDVIVVMDPVDGSTNASRSLPWYACSLCAVDSRGPWVALVVNLATGVRWEAIRGAGAKRDGVQIRTSSAATLGESLVALNGHPSRHLGWRQYRSLGATALDICSVADGSIDATVDCTTDALGVWDYLGAMLVLREAGGIIGDVHGRELVVLDPNARRTPVTAGSEKLFEEAMAARSSL